MRQVGIHAEQAVPAQHKCHLLCRVCTQVRAYHSLIPEERIFLLAPIAHMKRVLDEIAVIVCAWQR